jgi:hypothetical protein
MTILAVTGGKYHLMSDAKERFPHCPINIFFGFPIIITVDPMFAASANPIRKGVGFIFCFKRTIVMTGVKAIQKISFVRTEDSKAATDMIIKRKNLGV